MDVDDQTGGAGVDFRILLRGVSRQAPDPSALRRFESALRAASASPRVRVVEMRLLQPGPIALAVTIKVQKPAAFLLAHSHAIVDASYPVPAGLYSVYVGLEDTRGKIFWAIGGPNIGGQYVRPDLAACSSLSILGIAPPPPKCPA
jgi:hypothetical protein